jgi:NTP pyrophosphatase (non-canonical NTP hydrolase)
MCLFSSIIKAHSQAFLPSYMNIIDEVQLLSELTIKQAQEDVEKFLEEWGKKWKRVDNHFYIFTHLTEETGELARDIINAEFNLSTDRRKPSKKKETIARIEDDLGDILFHLLELANAYSIDLATAFKEAITSKHAKRFGA